MKWEELTARDFPGAVRKAKGLCVVPLGCIEKHGEHLPLGTDLYQVRAIAEAAARIEPFAIFPPYFFTQIHCAKHQPGTIAIRSRLMIDLIENVCEEIARNGFSRIILLNGHGGNEDWLPFFNWMMTYEKQTDYAVYLARLGDFWSDEKTPKFKKMKQTDVDGHAGEKETSVMLALHSNLVKMKYLPKKGARPLGRTKHLPLFAPISWYANFPGHYAGDGTTGTRKKGEIAMEEMTRNLVKIAKAVKNDTVALKLQNEFSRKIQH